ncbi:hypothetical protein H4Q26_003108 [Puccinia striiformis f. sp. tritici PST-130]|nr:hypothetical protein H4Q26_003108 [Puccinia striiformis f. sp. tritici PST-130]
MPRSTVGKDEAVAVQIKPKTARIILIQTPKRGSHCMFERSQYHQQANRSAYCLFPDHKIVDKKIFVYDLGGGTFDASLFTIEVKATLVTPISEERVLTTVIALCLLNLPGLHKPPEDITRPAIQQLDKEEQEETMKKQPSYSEASIIPNSFGPYIGTQRMGTRPGIKAQHYSQYSLTRPNDVNINSQGCDDCSLTPKAKELLSPG